MKINTLLSTVCMAELAKTCQNILNAHKQHFLCEDANLQSIISLLEQKNKLATSAAQDCKNYNKLEKCNQERNKALKLLYYHLKVVKTQPTSQLQEVANNILSLFRKYQIYIAKLATKDQTSQIELFCNELENPQFKALIKQNKLLRKASLGLLKAQAKLQLVQSNCTSKTKPWLQKQTTIEVINQQLVMYMRAMEKTSAETHANFAQKLAAEINKTNQNIKKQNHSKQGNNR